MRLVLNGYRVGFCEQALAFDERQFAPAHEFKRKARTLTGVLQLCAWMPAVLNPARNPVWAQFLFHKLLRLATPYLLLLMCAAAAGWLTLRAWTSAPQLAVSSVGLLVLTAAVVLMVSARAREGIAMAVAMQAATVRATLNAVRGRWDVWSR
jgi:hypothetical protein